LRKLLFVTLFLSVWLQAMPQAIVEYIRQSGIAKKDISIYIKEAGRGGKVVASLNAEKTRIPASVIKVLTTYAAVLKLGFDYRWPTKFYTRGTVKNGVLHGDLLIKGFGDPTLNDKDLVKIVSYIRAEGIGRITGDIVIDRSYFKVGNKDNSGFDQHTYSAYNAMPDAMMFNERISTVCVTPNKKSAYKKNSDGSYKLVNQLQYVNKPCKGRYSWPGVKIDKNEVMPTVILKGQISKRCGKRNVCKVITKPYKSFYYALKEKLNQEGVKVGGTLKLERISQDARDLFTYYSRSLEEIVSKTAKKSNNLYARQLLLLLGAKVYGAPATMGKGRSAIEQILSSKSALGTGVLRIDNGSGLSRVAKLNAKLLGHMLDNAYDSYGTRWMQTLSIAGVDGTIKRRFRHTVVKNRAWMKTGTVKRVKNIGGYVKNKKGKIYTAVILVNSPKARYRGAKLQNEIMKWLAKTSAKPSVRSPAKIRQTKKSVAPKTTVQNVFSDIETKVPSTSKKAATNLSKKYYVQVGSFSSAPDQKYLTDIKNHGLDYKVLRGTSYKVLVGPYENEKNARKVLVKVQKNLNKKAFIGTF